MNKEAQEALQEKFDALKSSLEAGFASKEEVKKATDSLEEIKTSIDKSDANQKKEFDHLAEQLNQLKEGMNTPESKVDNIDAVLKERAEDIAELKKNPAHSVSFEIKAATTMLVSTHADAGALRTERESGITSEMSYKPSIWDVLRKRFTNATVHTWVEKKPKEGSAGMVAEGASKPQKDFTFESKEAKAKKVAVVEKASKEMLDDIDEFRAFLYEDMRTAVSDEMKEQALLGDNTGENVQGLYGIATAFNAGGKTVTNANAFDVIRLAIAQITIAGGRASHVAINPADAVDFDLAKDLNGNYILPPFSTSNGTNIKGVSIIEDVNMPAGEFLVWDNTKAEVRIREDINITSGWENDDYRKNLVMFVCESRLLIIIKEPNYPAFVKGDFAAAITAITPVEGGE